MQREQQVVFTLTPARLSKQLLIKASEKLMKCKLDKWMVRWTETWLSCRVQRALGSSAKSSWRPVITGASQWEIMPNTSTWDLDNRTKCNLARWQDIQNPEECLIYEISDSEGPQQSREMGYQDPTEFTVWKATSQEKDLGSW
ncbi:hypothetical protein WISP_56208 [Willisornis vidua]|uniref:Uncharacterized protein n=1 Tax=Willisornis vidua TaxID=1566151 RepID=A0ABQ9DCK8_9PASS|nr:hypothetical protein WISP_56208 [Willisornis vidua]